MKKTAKVLFLLPALTRMHIMKREMEGPFARRDQGNQACYVALGSRLKGVAEVLTLGVRPNFHDYSPYEREMILGAKIILYPTDNYAEFLSTMAKRLFPSLETCLYADDKIKQTTLFYMLGIPHPRTRIYYHLHHGDVLEDFEFPFVAKFPRASARGRGVFRIENTEQLTAYLRSTNVAYIQEYLPHDRDLRVVLINYEPIIAYWRKRRPTDFRTNLSRGGSVQFEGVPADAVELAKDFARKCRFDDVGLDMICLNEEWYLIEANMKYGRRALKMKGLDLREIMRRKLLAGELFGP